MFMSSCLTHVGSIFVFLAMGNVKLCQLCVVFAILSSLLQAITDSYLFG